MSYTPYDDSIPLAQDALRSLKTILKVGEQHPNAADLPAARLYPDMNPLTFQVETVAEKAVRLLSHLSGSDDLRLEGELTTFADMFERIEKAEEILAKADREFINSRINEKVFLGVGDGKKAPFPGYALIFASIIPGLLFHVTTAYGILRKEGVPLSKADYITAFGSRWRPE